MRFILLFYLKFVLMNKYLKIVLRIVSYAIALLLGANADEAASILLS